MLMLEKKHFNFLKGPMPKNSFYYYGGVLKNVKLFKYVGIIFSTSETF